MEGCGKVLLDDNPESDIRAAGRIGDPAAVPLPSVPVPNRTHAEFSEYFALYPDLPLCATLQFLLP